MERQVDRWDRAVLGTVRGRSVRRLRRDLHTDAGDWGWDVGFLWIQRETSKGKVKVPSVQAIFLDQSVSRSEGSRTK